MMVTSIMVPRKYVSHAIFHVKLAMDVNQVIVPRAMGHTIENNKVLIANVQLDIMSQTKVNAINVI